MKILKRVQVGSLESSDCMITIEPDTKLSIKIDSSVAKQFYNNIKEETQHLLDKYNISNASVIIEDRGALPFALKARLEAAILRAGEENE